MVVHVVRRDFPHALGFLCQGRSSSGLQSRVLSSPLLKRNSLWLLSSACLGSKLTCDSIQGYVVTKQSDWEKGLEVGVLSFK